MENSITQMLVKKSLFATNKVFREIIVWLRVDLHIYTYGNSVTSHGIDWNPGHIKISLSRTNVVSHDFIHIIYICQTCEKPRNHLVFK